MNKSHKTQLEMYGGAEGYKEEMRRRRSLVKNPGFASMDPKEHRKASRKGGQNRWKNKDEKETTNAGQAL